MKQDRLFKYSLLISFFMFFLFGLLTGMLLIRHSIKKQKQLDTKQYGEMQQLEENRESSEKNVYYGKVEYRGNTAAQEHKVEPDITRERELTESTPAKAVETGTEGAILGKYYVIIQDGKLDIYITDPLEKYFTTSFEIGHLSDTMQIQLQQGMELQDDQELYDFLENISS